MVEVVWTEPALNDIDEIAEYISLDKPFAARKLVARIFSSVDRPEQFPASGRVPPKLERTRYREIIVGPCRIFYRVTESKVLIVYVMRAERQLREFILNERKED